MQSSHRLHGFSHRPAERLPDPNESIDIANSPAWDTPPRQQRRPNSFSQRGLRCARTIKQTTFPIAEILLCGNRRCDERCVFCAVSRPDRRSLAQAPTEFGKSFAASIRLEPCKRSVITYDTWAAQAVAFHRRAVWESHRIMRFTGARVAGSLAYPLSYRTLHWRWSRASSNRLSSRGISPIPSVVKLCPCGFWHARCFLAGRTGRKLWPLPTNPTQIVPGTPAHRLVSSCVT